MKNRISTYPNRTVCDILEEIRKCHETRNYSYLLGLVEEVQSAANRMEAKLYDNKDIESAREIIREAKKELEEINAEIAAKKDLKKLLK